MIYSGLSEKKYIGEQVKRKILMHYRGNTVFFISGTFQKDRGMGNLNRA